MHNYLIQIDDLMLNAIQKAAKQNKITEHAYIQTIIDIHQKELMQFPDGVIRGGCQKIITLLCQIPCLKNFEYSGVHFRYWSVTFELCQSSLIAWNVIHQLGWFLNSKSVEMDLPVVFKPFPNDSSDGPLCWEIASTAPCFDPAEVAEWLSETLPRSLSTESAWKHRDLKDIEVSDE